MVSDFNKAFEVKVLKGRENAGLFQESSLQEFVF